jgi:hypothetical protein
MGTWNLSDQPLTNSAITDESRTNKDDSENLFLVPLVDADLSGLTDIAIPAESAKMPYPNKFQ